MSAEKVLDLAEQQGLFDAKVTAELRRKMAESKFVVTPEAMAKILVDHGHLTPFQARKLVGAALGPQPEESPISLAASEVQADDDDDEIVMLDAVEPATPPPPRPAPTTKPAKLPRQPAPPRPAPPTDEEFVELETADLSPLETPAQPAQSRSNKPSAAEIAAIDLTEGLTPLTELTPPMPAGLMPLDDLLGPPADPLAAANPLQQPAMGKLAKAKRKNKWDSPLLLVGGGVLGALVLAFLLLFYALTRGSAAELFAQAEEDYQAGSYSSAMATYEAFLSRYPKSPQAGLARVRQGMSQIRLVTDSGNDPRQGLNIAKLVLPTIENEPEFEQARIELTAILPEITDGFATLAKQTGDTKRREELVKLAEESLTLVNNPVYLPAARRKEADTSIAAALDKLKAARRSIDQDKDLAQVTEQITTAVAANQTADAYQLRTTLLRQYPGLEGHPSMAKATLEISNKERALVTTAAWTSAAVKDDPRAPSTRIILASREGGEVVGKPADVAFLLLEGSVYALEVKSGKVLWRRHIGFDTTVVPQPLSKTAGGDALLVDARTNELLRLSGPKGTLQWRQALGEPLITPLVVGDKVFAASTTGHITQIDAPSGNGLLQATLPQQLAVAGCFDAKRNRLYQLGQHSTLFALSGETLQCEETFYLGHQAGAVLVPPVAVLDVLLVAESPTDDYTLLHVLAPRGETKALAEVGKPFRLTGRIVTPLSVSGRRVAAVTDLGQVAVFEVDPANSDKPVLPVGSVAASEKSPFYSHYTTNGSELWIAGQRCTKYEIQPSLQQLSRRWTLHQDDSFLAPLQTFGDVLIHVRRRPGSPAMIVEGCRGSDGKAIWTTQLGAPLVALSASEAREQLIAVTSQGRVFEIPRAAIGAGYFDEPAFVPLPGQSPTALTTSVDLGGGRLLCAGFESAGPAIFYDGAAESNRVRSVAFPTAAGLAKAAPIAFREGVLVPLDSGRVALFDPLQGASRMLPFQPRLTVGKPVLWQRPTRLPPDATSFAIGNSGQKVYRVTAQDQPQPHLAAVAEGQLPGELTSPLAAAVDTVYGVVREEKSDTVISLSAANLASGTSWPLQGRRQMGPDEAGGAVFVAAEPDGLMCFEAGQKLRWTAPLKHGPLSGPPVLCDGDFVVLTQRGVVARLSADTGEEVATVDLGEPLGAAAFVMGPRVLVAGYDGVLHIIPLPKQSSPPNSAVGLAPPDREKRG